MVSGAAKNVKKAPIILKIIISHELPFVSPRSMGGIYLNCNQMDVFSQLGSLPAKLGPLIPSKIPSNGWMAVDLAILSHIHHIIYILYARNTLSMSYMMSISFIWWKLARNRWMQQVVVRCSWFSQYGWSHQSHQNPPPTGFCIIPFVFSQILSDRYIQCTS